MNDQIDWLRNPALVLPIYTYVDAGHYAGIPAQTIRNWYKGSSRPGHTMLPVMARPDNKGLSYLQLAEVAFVARMRKRKLRLSAIRNAYWHVRDTLKVEYPFLMEGLHTNGTELFVEALGSETGIVNASRGGQLGWRAALTSYFHEFDYTDHLALRWHPSGRTLSVVIDPRISFGSPIVEGTGVPTYSVFSRLEAGDDLATVERDFNLTSSQVAAAIIFEENLKRAA